MRVKICGITSIETALETFEAGADFIGFVFAPSKRQLTPIQAGHISAAVPASLKKVGIFVDETSDTIMKIAEQAGLDIIQLHGSEPSSLATELPYPVIKAFKMGHQEKAIIETYPCDYYLIDSPTGLNYGGNGTAFNWGKLTDDGPNRDKLMLAGGLTPDNITTAINTAHPAAVDVSSGVETNGRKDIGKIQEFIKNAKQKG